MDLEPRRLFFLVCRHAYADGVIEPAEQEVLQRLYPLLGLPQEEVVTIVSKARQSLVDDPLEGDSMAPQRVFTEACQLAWADGVLEDHERAVLIHLAKVLALTGDQANAILLRTRPAPTPAKGPADPGPPPSSEGLPEILVVDPPLPDEVATWKALGLGAPSGMHEGYAEYRSTYWGGEN